MLHRLEHELLCLVLGRIVDTQGIQTAGRLAPLCKGLRDAVYSPASWQACQSLHLRELRLVPQDTKLYWVIQNSLLRLTLRSFTSGPPYLPALQCLKVRTSIHSQSWACTVGILSSWTVRRSPAAQLERAPALQHGVQTLRSCICPRCLLGSTCRPVCCAFP